MWDNELIVPLTTVALLMGFLIYKRWERARKRAAGRRRFHREGDVINVAPLRPRLEAVRRDFSRAAHDQARSVHGREGLVAAARRKLGSLPFFRRAPVQREGEHHPA